MDLSGNTSAEIHRGYTHHEMETLKGAMEKLRLKLTVENSNEVSGKNQKVMSDVF
jgi:hypothetical protein